MGTSADTIALVVGKVYELEARIASMGHCAKARRLLRASNRLMAWLAKPYSPA